MDYLEQHPWRQLILAPINILVSEEISEQNSDWEYLDGEMVKLGSLEHELLDIEHVQKIALSLLSSESKDLRILAHLLRTLQHSGGVLEILLALQLFYDYVKHYWADAAPVAELKKYRLTVQIIKRFDNAASMFRQTASRLEQDAALALINKLKDYWKEHKIEAEITALLPLYSLPQSLVERAMSSQHSEQEQINSLQSTLPQTKISNIEPIEIDASNDRAWKNTLFKVVEYLLERDIALPLGYQLRRYAIWSNITSAPLAEGNKTPLSPPSADRVADYEAAMIMPDITLWKDIEHSLTVSPYWFEGHYFSAMIAKSLGYEAVASVISSTLNEFLLRLPQLKELHFNDDTPFCSERLIKWLNETNLPLNNQNSTSTTEYLGDEILEENDMEIVLAQLNSRKHIDLKNKFYDQLTMAKLLEKQGFEQLAQQHYFSIYTSMEGLSVQDWETSLYTQLKEKLDIN